MGRGPGCGTATAIEGGERLNTGARYWRPVVKYRSYPGGGAVMGGTILCYNQELVLGYREVSGEAQGEGEGRGHLSW